MPVINRNVSRHVQQDLILYLEDLAVTCRKFKPAQVCRWLGISVASWWRWRNGHPMRVSTVIAICRKLGIDRRALRRQRLGTPNITMIDETLAAAQGATTPWYRWATTVKFGAELVCWFSRQRVDASLVAAIGGQPVRLSFTIGDLNTDGAAMFDLDIEPTADVWMIFRQRVGTTHLDLLEGNLSVNMLDEITKLIRFLTSDIRRTTKDHVFSRPPRQRSRRYPRGSASSEGDC